MTIPLRRRSRYDPVSSTDDAEDHPEEASSANTNTNTNTNTNANTSSISSSNNRQSGDRISKEDTPLYIKEEEEEDGDDDNGERVTVVVLDSAQKKFPISANPQWTVQRFKKVGATVHKIAPPSQRLIFRGKMLDDSKTLKDCGIKDNNVIVHLFPKPRVVVTSSSYLTENSNDGSEGGRAAEPSAGAHVPQIILDEEEQERRGQILVLGSHEIQEAQNNVKLLSLLLLVICAMRLLALFSIAMGVAEEPVYEDDILPNNQTDTNPYNTQEYQNLAWENQDYLDLAVSSIGFYVATLGMKATTENTLRLANAYLIGVVIAGIGWNAWNILMYALFVQEEQDSSKEDDDMIPLTSEDFVTVAFFTIMLPMGVWFLCCARAYQFRALIEEAELEAGERIRSQLTLSEGDGDGNDGSRHGDRELTVLSSSTSSRSPSSNDNDHHIPPPPTIV